MMEKQKLLSLEQLKQNKKKDGEKENKSQGPVGLLKNKTSINGMSP